jgi:hypothetical protein
MQTSPGTLEQVVELAKQWALAQFAAARTTGFALAPHRFELYGGAVRRHAIPPESREGQSPFDVVQRTNRPTVWAHSAVLTVLSDSDTGTDEHEEEVVEILAMDGSDAFADFAYVIRIAGFPPCLGRFHD